MLYQTRVVMTIQQGTAADGERLLALFDDAVAWLVARDQTGQWGSEPFSERPKTVERVETWAASAGLWFAVDDGVDAGAIVLGVDALPAACERLGFTRAGSFDVNGWPGAILVLPVGPPTM